MRTIILGCILLLASGVALAKGGTKKSDTFSVSGNCEQCKLRIENAAKKAGATKADWNVDTKVISVTYDPAKTTLDKIEQGIADTGYDTAKFPASTAAYEKLPHCCQYSRKE